MALQFLYQLDQNSADDPGPYEADFWQRHPVDPDTRAFAQSLVRGSKARQRTIDAIIARSAEHWELERMAVVDRNILRLGVYELLEEPHVPPKVAINEAIEIAKKFGTAESGRFVNGILDRVHRELRSAS